MTQANDEEYQDELRFQADEKKFEDKHHLPHHVYKGFEVNKMMRLHPDYRQFPVDLLNQNKWTNSRRCYAEKKLQDLIASKIVTRQTTIADLRNDVGLAKWYFWNYSDNVLQKHLDFHFLRQHSDDREMNTAHANTAHRNQNKRQKIQVTSSDRYTSSSYEQSDQDHSRSDNSRKRKEVKVSNYPSIVSPYIASGVGNPDFPDTVLIAIAMPSGSNIESLKEILINNDRVEGPILTIAFDHPDEFKDAETILLAEVKRIVNPLSEWNPRMTGLKNVLATRALGDGDVKKLVGRVILDLPFKASRSFTDILVEVHPSNASIGLITLKKLDESATTNIAGLLKMPPPS